MVKGKTKLEWRKYEGVRIIPIMGPSGAGKSTFINQLLGKSVAKVGHKLNSCTVELQPISVPTDLIELHLPLLLSKDGSELIIVDTPGFDNTSADDSEILKRVADWLANTYGAGARLAGVIYLQDISERRVTGAIKRNFEVFEKLCGADACKSIVLGTTRWQILHPADIPAAKAREEELQANFWRHMIKKGSTVRRVDDRDPNTSLWKLIETVLFEGKTGALFIQEELMDMGKSLPQTEAAAILRTKMEELIQTLKNAGATKEELRALAKEVEALKQKSIFAKIFGRFFR